MEEINPGRSFLKGAAIGALFGAYMAIQDRKSGLLRGPWESWFGGLLMFTLLIVAAVVWGSIAMQTTDRNMSPESNCLRAVASESFCETLWPY